MGYKAGQVSLIILTHANFDHYGSIKELKDITGAKIAVHKNDSQYLIQGKSAEVTPISPMGKFVMLITNNRSQKKKQGIKPDILIKDEMDFNRFGVKGKVISTPGHTEGSISILLDGGECIIGDMLGSTFGRLNYGSFCNDINMLKESIIKIKDSNAKIVYLSHGGACTIDKIRKAF